MRRNGHSQQVGAMPLLMCMSALGPRLPRGRRAASAVAASVFCAACQLYDPAGPEPTAILEILPCGESPIEASEPCQLEADGVSKEDIRVRIADLQPFDSDPTELTLRTTGGTLIAGTGEGQEVKIMSSGGFAEARLRSSLTAGSVTLSASAGEVSVSETVQFVLAIPDEVFLRSRGALTAKADGTEAIRIAAELSRAAGEGKPSTGLRVEFRASTDRRGDEVISELTQVVLSSENAVAEASLRSNTPYDSLFVVARVLDADPAVVSRDTLVLRFTN